MRSSVAARAAKYIEIHCRNAHPGHLRTAASFSIEVYLDKDQLFYRRRRKKTEGVLLYSN